VQKFKKLH